VLSPPRVNPQRRPVRVVVNPLLCQTPSPIVQHFSLARFSPFLRIETSLALSESPLAPGRRFSRRRKPLCPCSHLVSRRHLFHSPPPIKFFLPGSLVLLPFVLVHPSVSFRKKTVRMERDSTPCALPLSPFPSFPPSASCFPLSSCRSNALPLKVWDRFLSLPPPLNSSRLPT